MLARGEEPEIPDWHWEVLEEVEKSIKDGTAVFRPWEEVKAELQREFPNT